MQKKKLLIIYNKIWSYRIKIFDLIAEDYDLTVTYTDKKFIGKKYSFKTIYIPEIKIGPIYIHKKNLHKLAKNYDVVVGLSDIRRLNLMSLGMNPHRKYGLVYWGIGVRASYENKFDTKTKMDVFRYFLTKKADALIFYSSYPIKKYLAQGFAKKTLYVANNTVDAPITLEKEVERSQLLFIGTLYKAKGIELLLKAYKELKEEGKDVLPLKIVGGGEGYKEIKSWIGDNNLGGEIEMTGPIYDKKLLEEIFRSSVACISPNQAGLSVLSSMAYGCVFITKKDAITGGEIFNIDDGKTGIFYNGTKEDLKEKIIFASQRKRDMSVIGQNAFNHYRSNRTPEQMSASIIEAIKYALQKR